jgi:hypothetical protein
MAEVNIKPAEAAPKLAINCSRQFPKWLAEQKVSLAFD